MADLDQPFFEIWVAGSKTVNMFFECKEDAEKFYASLGAATGYQSPTAIQVFKKGKTAFTIK